MNQELPKRKPLRLRGFGYNGTGTYFITVCTHGHQCLFGTIFPVGAIHESPGTALSPAGTIAERYILQLSERFPEVTLDSYVVMPNHIHLLMTVSSPEERAIRESPLRGERSRLSKIVGYLKMNVSRDIRKTLSLSEIWQRGYHDHIVRDEADFLRIWTYIENNPLKWELDRYYMEAP